MSGEESPRELEAGELITAWRRRLELESLFGQREVRRPPAAEVRSREAPGEERERAAGEALAGGAPGASEAAAHVEPRSREPEPEPFDAGELLLSPEIAMDEVRSEAMSCTRCRLAETRTNVVFGEGSLRARVMFVGEGPGAEEDAQGRPFVGRAGQLLTKIIESIQLKREDVYIANVLKCRPPNNRDPRPDEVACCLGYLKRQIAAIRPVVICTLGSHAVKALLGVSRGVTSMRGRAHRWQGTLVVPTWHPAYLLRNPAAKRDTWNDIRLVRQLIDEADAS